MLNTDKNLYRCFEIQIIVCIFVPEIDVSPIKIVFMKRFKIKTVKDVMRFMFWVIVEKEYKLYSNSMKFNGFSEYTGYYQELLAKADKVIKEKKGIGVEALALHIEKSLLIHI